MRVRAFVGSFVVPSFHSVSFGQLLRCAHKCISKGRACLFNEYQSIRFRKKIATLFAFTFAKLGISPPTRCLRCSAGGSA